MAVALGTDDRPRSRVELSISCSDLQDKDFFSKSDPVAILYLKKDGNFKEYGRTEWQQNTLNPKFATTIEMDYFFEEIQQLKFCVYDIDNDSSSLDDDDFLGSLECTLGEIVSSSPFTRDLAGGGGKKSRGKLGTITIRAEELSNTQFEIVMQFVAENLDKKDFFGKSDPYLEFSKKNPDGSFTPEHKTEVIKNTLNPVWKPFTINSQKLCNSEPERTIRVTCYDWDSDGSHDFIGFFDTTFAELEAQQVTSWECINPEKKKKKKKYQNSGIIKLTSITVTRLYSFLEYIMGGCQINFTVGIDFTLSNNHPSCTNSLHYLHPSGFNHYTIALVAVGEVCQYYDSDKLFPAFGFGIEIGYEETSHTYALNGDPENPSCEGISGVVAAYKKAIGTLELSGPTYFAPIINLVARKATEAKEKKETQQYFILLMLTDGDIDDMTETKKAIIAASHLPMSIIIIGIGYASFFWMKELDSDEGMLSIDDEEAERDIVQFVPYRDYIDASPEALAGAVLAEVPGQLTQYMKKNKITPKNT